MPLLPFLTRNGTGSDFTGGLLSRKARVVTLDRQRRFFPRKINGPADNSRKKKEKEEKKYTPSYIHRFPRCEESQFRLASRSLFFVSSFKLRFSSQLDRSFVSLRNQTLRRPVLVWTGQAMRESQCISNSRILEF